MAFVWFQLYSNILARDTLHIAGISTAMHDVDAASRDKPCPSLLSHLYIGSCPLCNPFLTTQTRDHHTAFLAVHVVVLKELVLSLSK